MTGLPMPTTSIMEPGARDWVGFGLLFALAAACYLVVWAAARAGARADEVADRQAAAILFHTPNPAVSPYDQERIVDHAVCEGPCCRTVCRCHEDQRSDLLAVLCGVDDVPQGCGHGRSLCTDCALGECDECLTDARSQGVLSQYSPWGRSAGAAS